MLSKALGWLEENLRRDYRRNFLKTKKEKYILLKLQWWELLQFFFRAVFYFLLILGGILLTLSSVKDTDSLGFIVLAILVIVAIIMYESYELRAKERMKKLMNKAYKRYGPDFNISFYKNEKKKK